MTTTEAFTQQELVGLVALYTTLRHPGVDLRDPEAVVHRCLPWSERFVSHMRACDDDADLVYLVDRLRPWDAYTCAATWSGCGPDDFIHYVVQVGPWVVDLTAAQFGADVPIVYAFTELATTWRLVKTVALGHNHWEDNEHGL